MTREPSRAAWFCGGILVATLVFIGADRVEALIVSLWMSLP